jgi:ABC-2 type transport system ATP-binding protein
MPTNCIETQNLIYSFHSTEKVLNGINLQVPHESIYGFLGPNGAGKTTTLKLVLGLLKIQQGAISVFGKSLAKNRIEILKQTGSLIESPSLYGQLSAYENLSLLQKVYQCPSSRISEVLNLVGLPNTGSKSASQFSLGMKQRLSLAIALLHNPALIILDEPTNGLDPNGIIEMRSLLQHLNKVHGITILISSHQLSEIEKLATHIGIIHQGKMMFQGTLAELKDKEQQSAWLLLNTSDNTSALSIIQENEIKAEMFQEKIKLPIIYNEVIAHINRQLVSKGIDVYEISMVKNELEKIFMDLINQ